MSDPKLISHAWRQDDFKPLNSVWVVTLGALMLLAALLLPHKGLASQVVWLVGLVLLMTGAGIYVTRWGRSWLRRQSVTTAVRVARANDTAMVLTDHDGGILYKNPVAAVQLDSDRLRDAFTDLIAGPDVLIQRLRTAALTTESGQEQLLTRRGTVTVSATRVTDHVLLWQIQEAGQDSAPSGDALSLPMLTVGRSGTILYMNPAFRRLLGGRPKTLDQVFRSLPVDSGQVHRIDTAHGPLDALVAEVAGPGGRREIYLLPGSGGVVSDVMAPGWDVVEDLPVPMIKVALTGEVLAANMGARQLLKSDIAPGTRMSDLVDGLGRPIAEWLAESYRISGNVQPQFLRGAGSRKDLFVQVTLCRSRGGDVPHMLAVLHDVTEFKALETQFVQSQKMQAIGQLAGGVAHDFNNLLTAISGHCDLLLLRHNEDDPDYPDLTQICQNTNRAASLVGQLLAYSRKQDLKLVPVDLRDSIAELTHLLNRLVGEKVEVALQQDSSHLIVKADRRQLEQVIMNLVVNARDAMPDGGTVRIQTERVHYDEPYMRDRATVAPGDYVAVRVVDEGTGIPPEMIIHIFEPFYTTKGVGEGTGLGLSTAYGIIKQSGGFIFADSTVGEGSTFTVLLPALDPDEAGNPPMQEKPAVEQEPTPAATGVILLVEDEAPVRAFATRALRLRGYEVLEADCAEAALEMLEDGTLQVDLFITDVVMPGMDGPTWVRKALEQRPDIRVIFMSGYSEDGMREDRASIPNSVFLPKPFSLAQLTEAVQEQFDLS